MSGTAITSSAPPFREVTPEGQWSASSLVFNASFDPATLALTSTYHSLGNCGTSGTWLWSSDGSYTGWSFTLQLFRMQEKCDIEPGEMPITYQASQ